jgi:hypothetical protein
MEIRQLVSQIKREELRNYNFESINSEVIKNQTDMIEMLDMNPVCKLLYEVYRNVNQRVIPVI